MLEFCRRTLGFQTKVSLRRVLVSMRPTTRWCTFKGGRIPILSVYRSQEDQDANLKPLEVMIMQPGTTIEVENANTLHIKCKDAQKDLFWTFHFENPVLMTHISTLLKQWLNISDWILNIKLKSDRVAHPHEGITQYMDRRNQKMYAVKRIQMPAGISEVQMMLKLQNLPELKGFLVPIKFIFVDASDDVVNVVMPFCFGGTLTEKLHSKGALGEKSAVENFYRILNCISKMHRLGIYQLNLDASKVLFHTKEKDSRILITGIGKAGLVSNSPVGVSPVTPYSSNYTSPTEKARKVDVSGAGGTSNTFIASDFVDAGLLLHEMLVGYRPNKNDLIQYRVKKDASYFDDVQFDGISDGAKDLIGKLLLLTPHHFYSFKEVMKHPWLRKMRETTRSTRNMDVEF